MSELQFPPVPWTTSRSLPEYQGLLAVDAKSFTSLPALLHAPTSCLIPALVDEALERAGLGDLKEVKAFPANTGDGVVFGFPPSYLPFIVWPFLNVLDDELGRYNARCAAPRIRLRASVHVGPLPDSGAAGDGNGTARNDVHRLLDSHPVRQLLADTSESATHLAAIISDRVYEDVVLGGYSGLHPDRCAEVVAGVAGKSFSQRAWVYVPSPSGNLLNVAADTEEMDRPNGVRGRDADACAPAGGLMRGGASQRVGNGVALIGNVTGGLHFDPQPGKGQRGSVGE
ncbi:hypothetical protein [Kitasatospora sp. NPDC087315]|uniref:hypothetical protein n=1 Tax=Kitasatospora sp. NPDC087315 TaxID=3364069 RepID=UPI003807C68C